MPGGIDYQGPPDALEREDGLGHRRHLTRNLLLLVLVSGLLFAACAGDNDADGSGAVEQPVSQPDVAGATDTLVTVWGAEDSFVIVMGALDLGYSAGQIITEAASVSADGSIDGVAPEGAALGLFSAVGPDGESGTDAAAPGPLLAVVSVGIFAQDEPPRDLYYEDGGEWLSKVHEDEVARLERLSLPRADSTEEDLRKTVTLWTLQLSARGYSPKQILDGFLTFDITVAEGRSSAGFDLRCLFIDGPNGPILPADRPWGGLDFSTCNPIEAGTAPLITTTTAETPTTTEPISATTSPPATTVVTTVEDSELVTYRGIFDPGQLQAALEGAPVTANEVEMTVDSGVIVDFSAEFAITEQCELRFIIGAAPEAALVGGPVSFTVDVDTVASGTCPEDAALVAQLGGQSFQGVAVFTDGPAPSVEVELLGFSFTAALTPEAVN